MVNTLHFLFAALVCGADATPPSVGMVEAARSPYSIVRPDGKSELKNPKDLVYLWKGDQVEVPQDGEAVLRFFEPDGRRRIVSGRYVITEADCQPLAKSPPPTDAAPARKVPAALKQGWKDIGKGSGRGAGLVLRGGMERSLPEEPPPAVTPIAGELTLTDRPEFSWRIGKPPFRLHLSLAGSRRKVWTASSEKQELSYPADAPPLKRNRKYLWEVWSHADPESPLKLLESTFHLASEETGQELLDLRKLMDSKSPFDLLLVTASFQACGAESEALAACEKLLARLPNDPDVLRLAAELYDKAGRLEEGEAAYQRALELGLKVEKKD